MMMIPTPPDPDPASARTPAATTRTPDRRTDSPAAANPCAAARVFAEAAGATGSLLSIGLEPSARYLPDGFEPTIAGHRAFLLEIIRATRGHCAAYKPNLAFFEALGVPGWQLLHEIREALPADTLLIADAKRGDIGTSAERYAHAIFNELDFHAITINPLMGEDACRPFLDHADRLSFALVLTSNPGASDFLAPNDLYLRIAERIAAWGQPNANAGFVVGATRPSMLRHIRDIAPDVPILAPGVGAQGGDAEGTIAAGLARSPMARPGLIVHATRAILPDPDAEDLAESINAKARALNEQLRNAMPAAASTATGGNA
ncbi:MAG: orotidine-5'-phosphate decarboxylase [Phycisphaerales bacterium]